MLSMRFFVNFSSRKVKMDKNKCPFSKSAGLSLTRFLLIII
jgi:hypothetical protein